MYFPEEITRELTPILCFLPSVIPAQSAEIQNLGLKTWR